MLAGSTARHCGQRRATGAPHWKQNRESDGFWWPQAGQLIVSQLSTSVTVGVGVATGRVFTSSESRVPKLSAWGPRALPSRSLPHEGRGVSGRLGWWEDTLPRLVYTLIEPTSMAPAAGAMSFSFIAC